MKKILLPVLLSTILVGFSYLSFSQTNIQNPDKDQIHSQQLLIVVTNGWDSLQGEIYGFEKRKDKWKLQFSNKVVVGRKGLGIGEGIVPLNIENSPLKKEGDLKAPAGIFTIGTAFGYENANKVNWIKNPYVKASDTLICVDDMNSVYYNQLVKTDSAKSDWKSYEHMHRPDDLYKWGLFINHNGPRSIQGKGSCIFMHIWENEKTGTEGCTAMKEENLIRILHWINNVKHPVLVQVPKEYYPQLATLYQLPPIKNY